MPRPSSPACVDDLRLAVLGEEIVDRLANHAHHRAALTGQPNIMNWIRTSSAKKPVKGFCPFLHGSCAGVSGSAVLSCVTTGLTAGFYA